MGKKYEFSGVVEEVGKVETFKNFSKRAIVLCDDPNGKYPQHLQFEATGDNIALLDKVTVNDNATVEFFLNGRKWDNPKTGKTQFFTTLRIASLVRTGVNAEKVAVPEKSQDAPHEAVSIDDTDIDDMPF